MTELNVKIAPPLADYVEDLVASGRYATADEAVADALQRLQDGEPETPEYTAWLKHEVQKGLDDIAAGHVVDWDPEEIMREVERRLAAK